MSLLTEYYAVGTLVEINPIHPFIAKYISSLRLGTVSSVEFLGDSSYHLVVDVIKGSLDSSLYIDSFYQPGKDCEVMEFNPCTIQDFDIHSMATRSVLTEMEKGYPSPYEPDEQFEAVKEVKVMERTKELAHLLGVPMLVPSKNLQRKTIVSRMPDI